MKLAWELGLKSSQEMNIYYLNNFLRKISNLKVTFYFELPDPCYS